MLLFDSGLFDIFQFKTIFEKTGGKFMSDVSQWLWTRYTEQTNDIDRSLFVIINLFPITNYFNKEIMFSENEKFAVIRLFYKNNNNVNAARAEYARLHPGFPIPSRAAFYDIERRFRERKSLERQKRRIIPNEELELTILLYFQERPQESTVNASRQLEISQSKIIRTLHKYKYRPYKMMPVQKLTQNQKIQRLEYCTEMLRLKNGDPNFFEKILWTDEATFTTAGIYNRKNTHTWANENPHCIREIPNQGRTSLNVWCGILRNKIVGPLFYEGALTGERYLHFLENQIENKLEDLPLIDYTNLIWHQDGAPPHRTRAVRNHLNNRFDLWIGNGGNIQWPSNSPDLTPLDSFLWGYLKNEVYKETSINLDELRHKVDQCIQNLNEFNSHFILNAVLKINEDYTKCINNNGGHTEHL